LQEHRFGPSVISKAMTTTYDDGDGDDWAKNAVLEKMFELQTAEIKEKCDYGREDKEEGGNDDDGDDN
jgi:hypothetical protein